MSNMGGNGGGDNGDDGKYKPHLAALHEHQAEQPDYVIHLPDVPENKIIDTMIETLAGGHYNLLFEEDGETEALSLPLYNPQNRQPSALMQSVLACYGDIMAQPPFCDAPPAIRYMTMKMAAAKEAGDLSQLYIKDNQLAQKCKLYRQMYPRPTSITFDRTKEYFDYLNELFGPLPESNEMRPDLSMFEGMKMAKRAQEITSAEYEVKTRCELALARLDMNDRETAELPPLQPRLKQQVRVAVENLLDWYGTEEAKDIPPIQLLNTVHIMIYSAIKGTLNVREQIFQGLKERHDTSTELLDKLWAANDAEMAESYAEQWGPNEPGNSFSHQINSMVRDYHEKMDAAYSPPEAEEFPELFIMQPDELPFYDERFGRDRTADPTQTIRLDEKEISHDAYLTGNALDAVFLEMDKEYFLVKMDDKSEPKPMTLDAFDAGNDLGGIVFDQAYELCQREPFKHFSPNTHHALARALRSYIVSELQGIEASQGYITPDYVNQMVVAIAEGKWINGKQSSRDLRRGLVEHAYFYEFLYGAITLTGNTTMENLDPEIELGMRIERTLNWIQSQRTGNYKSSDRIILDGLDDDYGAILMAQIEKLYHLHDNTIGIPLSQEDRERGAPDLMQIADASYSNDEGIIHLGVEGKCMLFEKCYLQILAYQNQGTSIEEAAAEMEQLFPKLAEATVHEMQNLAGPAIPISALSIDGRSPRESSSSEKPSTKITADGSADCDKAEHAMLDEHAPASAKGATIH